MHGRGAMDTKGGLAALMVATARAAENGVDGTVLFTGVADEEFASFVFEVKSGEFEYRVESTEVAKQFLEEGREKGA